MEPIPGKEIFEEGFLSEELFDLVKKAVPVFCVDAVLVPESETPSALLIYRTKENFASPSQYWLVGGRVKKGQTHLKALKEKIKKETNLDVDVKAEDLLFVENGFHIKNKEDGKFSLVEEIPKNTPQKDIYHTPVLCYLVKIPSFKSIEKDLKIGNMNEKFKLFTKIDKNLNSYVKKAIEEAWKRCNYSP